jgi:hypothetical protein
MHCNLQHIMTRLYIDAEFRNEFLMCEADFFSKHQVTENEQRQLLEISKQELELFSKSLLTKRMEVASKFIPATFFLLGKNARTEFFKFAASTPSHGIDKHYSDALDFLSFITRRKNQSELITQMAEFEKVILLNQKKIIAKKFLRVKYNHPEIRRAIQLNKEPDLSVSKRMLLFKKGKPIKNFPFF